MACQCFGVQEFKISRQGTQLATAKMALWGFARGSARRCVLMQNTAIPSPHGERATSGRVEPVVKGPDGKVQSIQVDIGVAERGDDFYGMKVLSSS
jgi:hypothetical protein